MNSPKVKVYETCEFGCGLSIEDCKCVCYDCESFIEYCECKKYKPVILLDGKYNNIPLEGFILVNDCED